MLAAAVAWAQSAKPKINLDDPKQNPPAGKTEPAKAAGKTAPKKDDKKKDDDKPGKIEGMEIKRGDGYLGLRIVNGTFRLSFYDAKKKPVPPDVTRAALRWNVNYQKQPERAILQSDGKALASEKIIKPPYRFKLFMTLFKEAGDSYESSDAGAENITVDFAQDG